MDSKPMMERVHQLIAHIENDRSQTAVAMMQPKVVGCEPDVPSLTMAFPALAWELNPNGVVHGGLVSTMFDTAMGIAAYAVTGRLTPTISLTTSYLRPAPGEGTLIVRARVTMSGRTVVCVSAEMWERSTPEKLVATAQGSFHNPAEQENRA